MPQQFNPITAPLSMLKQLGEQTNRSIQAIQTSFAQTASMGLDTLMAGAPPLPGVPGNTAARGNPAQQLLPGNMVQALSQLENLAIPPGLPRLTQMMRGITPAAPPAAPPPTPVAVAAPRRIMERRGI